MRELAIDLATMANSNDRNQEVTPLVGIDDSVRSDSKAPEALPGGAHDRALVGVISESFDRGNYALALARL